MKLKRSMGLWMATALVVGNMIGSGIFLLPATLADAAGPVSLVGWAFTGAGVVLLARWWGHRKAEYLEVPVARELVGSHDAS